MTNRLDASSSRGSSRSPRFYLHGLWYSLTVLGILGCHEMGHYVACLRYGVDATRPYFLPAPLPLTGTLGAFIRIRSRIPSKIALFDIGIAGPIAGFVVAVPALFIGLALSDVVRLPDDQSSLMSLGEPLLFRLAAWLVFGDRGRRLLDQHASDGVCGVVRTAGDSAQSVSHRAARRRSHQLCGAGPPLAVGHAGHGRRSPSA